MIAGYNSEVKSIARDLAEKLKTIDFMIKYSDKRQLMCKKEDFLLGRVGELMVQDSLEDLCYEIPSLVVPGIENLEESDYVEYTSSDFGTIIAQDSESGDDIAEYDSLILVDGFPVINEVKLNSSLRKKRNRKGTKKHDKELLSAQRIRKKMRPILESYGKRVGGFFFITYANNMPRPKGPAVQVTPQGVIYIRFPESPSEYHEKIKVLKSMLAVNYRRGKSPSDRLLVYSS